MSSQPDAAATTQPSSTVDRSSTTESLVSDPTDAASIQTSYVLLTPSGNGVSVLDASGATVGYVDVNASTMSALRDADQAGRYLILMDGISLVWVDVDEGAVVDVAQYSGLSPTGHPGVWVATADPTLGAPIERSWVLADSPDTSSPVWVLPTSEYPFAGGDDWVISWDRQDLGMVVRDRQGSSKFAHGQPVAGTGTGAVVVSERSMWAYDASSQISRRLFDVGDYLPAETLEAAETWLDGRTVAYLSRDSEASTEAQLQVFNAETGEIKVQRSIDGATRVRWLDATNILIQGTAIAPLILDLATGTTEQVGDAGDQLFPLVRLIDR